MKFIKEIAGEAGLLQAGGLCYNLYCVAEFSYEVEENMQKTKKMALSTQIFIALVLAIIAGVLLTANPAFATGYIKPFGTIFLNLIKWIVCPLVFFSIMAGVVSMRDIKKVGSIYHIVLVGAHDVDEEVKEKLDPLLWEAVQIDPDEVVALQMLLAKKGGMRHE